MAKLFVNGVNAECPREAVVAVFSLCGEVTDVYIHPSRGFAFVTMADAEGASQAIKELNGQKISYKTLMVQNNHNPSSSRRNRRHAVAIYLAESARRGNLRGGLGDDGKPSWSLDGDGIFWMDLWYKLRQKKDPQIMA